jgi:hypothetical protein
MYGFIFEWWERFHPSITSFWFIYIWRQSAQRGNEVHHFQHQLYHMKLTASFILMLVGSDTNYTCHKMTDIPAATQIGWKTYWKLKHWPAFINQTTCKAGIYRNNFSFLREKSNGSSCKFMFKYVCLGFFRNVLATNREEHASNFRILGYVVLKKQNLSLAQWLSVAELKYIQRSSCDWKMCVHLPQI